MSSNQINNTRSNMNNSSSYSLDNTFQNTRNTMYSSDDDNNNSYSEESSDTRQMTPHERFDKALYTYSTDLEMYQGDYPDNQNTHIPMSSRTLSEKYTQSADWRASQRKNYTKGRLSQERMDKIESRYPEFFDGLDDKTDEERFDDELKQYDKSEEWRKRQIGLYRKGKLTDEQVNRIMSKYPNFFDKLNNKREK